jgi:hypothetical protein
LCAPAVVKTHAPSTERRRVIALEFTLDQEGWMKARSVSLHRMAYIIGIGVLTVIVLWPWMRGPALVGVASFTGWAISGFIDDRIASRSFAWKTALAQGVVSGLTVWLTLRWLEG